MKSSVLTALFATLLAAGPALAQSPDAKPPGAPDYPLKTCIVSDEPLGNEPVDYTHKEAGKPDRFVRFCCDGCVDDFKAEPAKFLAKLEAASKASPTAKPTAEETSASTVEAQKTNYPLNVCAISGEELGSMGKPFDHVHQAAGQPDRLVRMCCKGCLKTFKKDPAKYIARIDSAAKSNPKK